MGVLYLVSITAIIAFFCNGQVSHGAIYSLKNDAGQPCIIVNSTLIVSFNYEDTQNKTVHTSWTLSKPSSDSVRGYCATKTVNNAWSEISINVSKVLLGIRFVSGSNDRVILANVSVTVDIVNGSTFKNPRQTGRVTLVAQPNMDLSSNSECFSCKSNLLLTLTSQSLSLAKSGQVQMFGGTLIQAFNITNGKMSGKVVVCSSDRDVTTTVEPATTTSSTPSDQPPLLTLTVLHPGTRQPCLRIRSRLQFLISYLKPGLVGKAVLFMRGDAKVSGDCGDKVGPNGTAGLEQTMTVKFFENWSVTFKLVRSAGTSSGYSLTSIKLDYNVNNATYFPDATDIGKLMSASVNTTYISAVPSNGYYACKSVNFTMDGPSVPEVGLKTDLALAVGDFALQAFRTGNSTADFVGDKTECSGGGGGYVDNVIPIAVGAALAGLIVIVLVAYLVSRRLAVSREGYQSV